MTTRKRKYSAPYQYPQTITPMIVDRIPRPMVRVMLDYMGMPIRRQPTTISGEQDELKRFVNEAPETTQRAYELIVLHKKPEDSVGKPVQSIDMDNVYVKIAELWQSMKDNATTSLIKIHNDKLEEALNSSKQLAAKAIAEESKKFRTVVHNVKVGRAKQKKVDGVLPKEFTTLLQLAQQRKNILMVGPAGCGKTYIAGKIAESLDLNFGSQSCSEGMSESQLTGWLLPINGTGAFEYVPSVFIDKYENGGVFLFDEVDASDPNVMVFINQALANDSFYLPLRHKNPMVKKHKNFVAVAAGNTYGNGADAMYVGRNQLDAATLDRFKVGTVMMSYDEDVERSLTNDVVYAWGTDIRALITQHRLRRIMSTRVMKDATDMMDGQGWELEQVSTAYFSDWSKEELAVIGKRAA